MDRLKAKICLITGAARGIGAAIARAFAAEGAAVIVTDIDVELGKRTAKEIGCPFHKLDVASEADWKTVMAAVGPIDVLVNNAGITGFESGAAPHDPENASLEDWHAVHAVNLDGGFLGCKYAIKSMRGQGAGSIINISSRSGMIGVPAAAAYASSKAGIRNHSKTVALYCAQQGLNIRCNSIHPGAILTPMWEPMLGQGPAREEAMKALMADTPLKRFGQPEEVAALALLLASDEAAYITGAELTIDGGLMAGTAAAPER
jgi:3(or 17)beta-hydroxysteroid dehydrogenase